MANDIQVLGNVPSYLTNYKSNINLESTAGLEGTGVDYATITKTNRNGFKIVLSDGTLVPQQPKTLPLVFIRINANVRTFFEADYDPDEPAAPDCQSHNGKVPDANCRNPQSSSCATCKNNVFDASNPKKGWRCKKLIQACVVPVDFLTKPNSVMPMMYAMRLSTADYVLSKTNPNEKNFLPYVKQLTKVNMPLESIATKVSIDESPKIDYGKCNFEPMRWLEQHEFERVIALQNSDECKHITGEDIPAMDSSQVGSSQTSSPQPQANPLPPVQQSAPVQQPQPQEKPKQEVNPFAGFGGNSNPLPPAQPKQTSAMDNTFGAFGQPQQEAPKQNNAVASAFGGPAPQQTQESQDSFFNSIGEQTFTAEPPKTNTPNELPDMMADAEAASDWLKG